MSRQVNWNVELQTRQEVITVREILHDLEPVFSSSRSHPRMEVIDLKGRKHVFSCTQEEQNRIRKGAQIILTIKESIVSTQVSFGLKQI